MALLFFGSRYSKLSAWRILLVFFLAAMLTACGGISRDDNGDPPKDPPEVNINPVITEGASTSVNMDEDGSPTAFSLTLNATDDDDDILTWSVNSAATNGTATASGTGTSKAISYTPTTDYNGSDSFVVQVADGNGGTDTITVNVTIAAVNDAPVISGTPSISVNEDTAYSFTPTADDVDMGDTLTFSIANQPSWANFDTGTGALTGTPTHADVGTYSNIIITVTDDGTGNLSDSLAAFSIEVVDNVAPTVNASSEVPLNGATDVSPDIAISATFSEALAPGSVSVTSFTLVKTSDSSSVTGTVSLTKSDTVPTFTPSSNLEYGTQYTATLTTAITDATGNPLASDKVWSFTTILKYATQIKKISWDGQTDDRFGYCVSISGDYAIVGAYLEDSGGSNAGAAYIFRRTGNNTWDSGIKIVAPDWKANDNFGISVAISGDYAIVGAYGSGGSYAGAAYIFRRIGYNMWDSGIKIVAPDGQNLDVFGTSVAISGDYAIVGAEQEDSGGSNAGAAYIFRRIGYYNTWDSGYKIMASDSQSYKWFGQAVAISGDYAIVGSGNPWQGTIGNGAAYIFKRTGTNIWYDETKIVAFDAEVGDYFGTSVSISGNYAIVGAIGEDSSGSNAGAAYIFKRTGTNIWGNSIKIVSSSGGEADNEFGYSVAINGDNVIVGESGSDTKGVDAGAAHIFTRIGTNTWKSGMIITASDAEDDDKFGSWVSISGDYAIVGAPYEDSGGSKAGAVYILK